MLDVWGEESQSRSYWMAIDALIVLGDAPVATLVIKREFPYPSSQIQYSAILNWFITQKESSASNNRRQTWQSRPGVNLIFTISRPGQKSGGAPADNQILPIEFSYNLEPEETRPLFLCIWTKAAPTFDSQA